MKRRRLGQVHRERGNISISALDKSLQEQQGRLVYLGELVLERGVVSKAGLAALAEVTRARNVDAGSSGWIPRRCGLVPLGLAPRCCVLPL